MEINIPLFAYVLSPQLKHFNLLPLDVHGTELHRISEKLPGVKNSKVKNESFKFYFIRFSQLFCIKKYKTTMDFKMSGMIYNKQQLS